MDKFERIARENRQDVDRRQELVVPQPLGYSPQAAPMQFVAAERVPGSAEHVAGRPDLRPGLRPLAPLYPRGDAARARLAELLAAERAEMEPYLANFAPDMESTRQRGYIREFRWWQEEPELLPGQDRPTSAADAVPVSIPHYGGPLGKARTHYEIEFSLPEYDRSKQAAFICFEGADYCASVFVNDRYVGSHEGFFAPFDFAIDRVARPGENLLHVELTNDYVFMGSVNEAATVDIKGEEFAGDKVYAATGPGYDEPEQGWHHCPPGMGLYNRVYWELRPLVALDNAFVRCADPAHPELWVEIDSLIDQPQRISLNVDIYGRNFDGHVLTISGWEPGTEWIAPFADPQALIEAAQRGAGEGHSELLIYRGRNKFIIPLEIANPKIWSPDTPWLYQLQVELLDDSAVRLDTLSQQFGLRTFTQQREEQPYGDYYLNGEKIYLRGANTMGFEQQDVMREDWEQLIDDILLARVCNMNYWRLTQRPVQREVYEYCDRLGLMTQTDLPFFACVRRSKAEEVRRQAEEMERLVRPYACNIQISYMNEPHANGKNRPHINLTRAEMEELFVQMDQVVWRLNPERVIKHVEGDFDPPGQDILDFHCYTMWYNGAGIDVGKLWRGYWVVAKPGWHHSCCEYGAEGLEDVAMSYRRYPSKWLPEPGSPDEAEWTPERIKDGQTGAFYPIFFDHQSTVAEWVEASQAYQALAVRMMTEAFRRDPRMVAFAVHLFIDAFPAGWMKSIMDCERNPKQAFWAYRDVLEPILISLRTDKFNLVGGSEAEVEVFICNDTPADDTCVFRAALYRENGDLHTEYDGVVTLPAIGVDCPLKLNSILPVVEQVETLTLTAALYPTGATADAAPLTRTQIELRVFPAVDTESFDARICRIADLSSAKLAEVQAGATLLIELSDAGKFEIAGSEVEVEKYYRGPYHFASRKTGHPWVEGFGADDFRLWYDEAAGSITPLADKTWHDRSGGEWQPVLICGHPRDGHLIIAERCLGAGRLILSVIPGQRLLDDPAGRVLLSCAWGT